MCMLQIQFISHPTSNQTPASETFQDIVDLSRIMDNISMNQDASKCGKGMNPPIALFNAVRDDIYVDHLIQGCHCTASFAHGKIPRRPTSSMVETVNKIQIFSHDTMSADELSRLNFQNPPTLQYHHSSYRPCQVGSGSIGVPLSASRYSDDLHRSNTSHLFDFGSRKTAHYNPYVSTFDKPLSSKFSSKVLRQMETPHGSKYGSPFSFGGVPVDGLKAGTYGVNQMISCGDQYDPLIHSIEPSVESLEKYANYQDHAADKSKIMSRFRGSHKSFNFVKNRRKNDEFGEAAGAVESGRPRNPNFSAKGARSKVEIDQDKKAGNNKESKGSRSIKLFKAELANFVMEMIKPSWRQGNVSKEAFKTIVRKSVQKVSGTMTWHKVPKSKATTKQYIDFSRKKLTHLVQAYVDKYARA